MDRLALLSAFFFSLILATSGSMITATVAARKGYPPRWGTLVGWLVGFVGGLLPAYLWLIADQPGSYAVLIGIIGSLGALNALWRWSPDLDPDRADLPLGDALRRNLVGRQTRALIMRFLFMAAIAAALFFLAVLLWTILDRSIGLVAVQSAIEPEALVVTAYDAGGLGAVAESDIPVVLANNVRLVRLQQLVLERVADEAIEDWSELQATPLGVLLGDDAGYDAALTAVPINALTSTQAADVLAANLDPVDLRDMVYLEAGRGLTAHDDALSVLSTAELIQVLVEGISADDLQRIILTDVMGVPEEEAVTTDTLVWPVFKWNAFPVELGEQPLNTLTAAQSADILVHNLPREQIEEIYILHGQHLSFDDVSDNALGALIAVNVRKARLRVIMLDRLAGISPDDLEKMPDEERAGLGKRPLRDLLKGKEVPAELADLTYTKLSEAQFGDLFVRNLGTGDLQEILYDNVVEEQVVQGWSLYNSLTQRSEIDNYQRTQLKRANLEWHSWVNRDFFNNTISYTRPDETGIRSGLRGTLLIILITILFAFPIGVGAAIYLEEYAVDIHFDAPWLNAIVGFMNRIIQTNISNLAGVPSIIYGILGLAIFVRTLEMLTSGSLLGGALGLEESANGRTVLSAGFTLALLILPLIIINAQEAIRAVPDSLRQASYGLGATKWQTIWHHVLPYAMPGVLTGTILALSRAIGETAPLILVGGATFLLQDPSGPFSQFTALPLLIYRWTTLPQSEFRNAAAAAIVVLLLLLLTLNSIAVILRNRFTRRLS